MEKLPPLTHDLIDQLDKEYPELCPGIEWNERRIWFYAGARSVVRKLLALQKEQEDNILEQ